MRDFSWKYFTVTGNIDAYLLFKEHSNVNTLADTGMETAATVEAETEETLSH
jgi:hypothetical protein